MTRLSTYNPGALERDDLVDGFVARHALLGQVAADLHKPKPRHRLFIGPRGMGKTTLLRRIYFAALEDADIAARWTPLVFREEQYNVATLGDFWLNCLDSLADALDEQDVRNESAELDSTIDRLRDIDQFRMEREALQRLDEEAEKRGRGFLLLVDNVDLMFDRLSEDEQWRLRDALSNRRLLLFGACVTPHRATYEYNAPFYEFFAQESLRGLADAEVSQVLLLLSERRNTPDVARIVRDDPGRIRTLRALSGGNPRAIVLVHQVLAAHDRQSVVDDVESLMDMSTPLYKSRFEALSKQAQIIVDAMATAWDPITAARAAKMTRLDVNVVSSQLSRLTDDGVVEKVKYPGAKAGFQIAERMFNIWYLMRANRRTRRKLVWLVEFLSFFYGDKDAATYFHDLAQFAKTDTDAQLVLAYASRLQKERARVLEYRAIEVIVANAVNIREELEASFDLEGADRDLSSFAQRAAAVEEIRRLLKALPPYEDGTTVADAVLGIVALSLKERLRIAEVLRREKPGSEHMRMLFERYVEFRDTFAQSWSDLMRAVQRGVIDSLSRIKVSELEALRDVDTNAFEQCFGLAVWSEWSLELKAMIPVLTKSESLLAWYLWLMKAEALDDLEAVEELFSTVQTSDRSEMFWSSLASVSALNGVRGAFWIADRILSEQRGSPSEGKTMGWILSSIMMSDGAGGVSIDDSNVGPSSWMHVLLRLPNVAWQTTADAVRKLAATNELEAVLFARAAVQAGHAQSAADLLLELGLAEKYRPVYEALLAAANGPDHLLTVAPEVREPSANIHRWITFKKVYRLPQSLATTAGAVHESSPASEYGTTTASQVTSRARKKHPGKRASSKRRRS